MDPLPDLPQPSAVCWEGGIIPVDRRRHHGFEGSLVKQELKFRSLVPGSGCLPPGFPRKGYYSHPHKTVALGLMMKDRAGFASTALPLLQSRVTVSFIEQTRASVKVKRGRAVINDGQTKVGV